MDQSTSKQDPNKNMKGCQLNSKAREVTSKGTAQCPWIKGKKLLNASGVGKGLSRPPFMILKTWPNGLLPPALKGKLSNAMRVAGRYTEQLACACMFLCMRSLNEFSTFGT